MVQKMSTLRNRCQEKSFKSCRKSKRQVDKTIYLKGLSFNLSVALGRTSSVTVNNLVPLKYKRGTCEEGECWHYKANTGTGGSDKEVTTDLWHCTKRRPVPSQDWHWPQAPSLTLQYQFVVGRLIQLLLSSKERSPCKVWFDSQVCVQMLLK